MKAIVLFSGGLDSSLTTLLMRSLGLELTALNFTSPFCRCLGKSGCMKNKIYLEGLGIKFASVSLTDEYLEIVKKPKHGYGKNLNPCIDCRVLIFKKAKEVMQKLGAKFIITGEVLAQRPMSQHRLTLKLIEKEAGLEGLVLRPLSAQLLDETIPEKRGWVDRGKLLKFNGRSRRPQMDLAKEYNLKDYPCPSGGCLLTDSAFTPRVEDLLKHNEFSLKNVQLLKVGRHFRLSKSAKLIVGRNEQENVRLNDLLEENDFYFLPPDINGPAALGRGEYNAELINLAASVVSRYCDRNGQDRVKIQYSQIPLKPFSNINVLPLLEEECIIRLRI